MNPLQFVSIDFIQGMFFGIVASFGGALMLTFLFAKVGDIKGYTTNRHQLKGRTR